MRFTREAGDNAFAHFSDDYRSRFDHSTPVRQRRVTGLVFRVASTLFWKGGLTGLDLRAGLFGQDFAFGDEDGFDQRIRKVA
jgi:hypothetical protein